MGVVTVAMFVVDGHTPDWIAASTTLLWSVVAAAIGFLHGITIFVARERDANDAAQAVAPLCLDDYCADVECPNRHE
jgi:hypothetical protein